MNIEVPCDTWRRVSDFFAQIVAPCKECVWGNPTSCWRSQCAAFRYRPIAKEVLSVAVTNTTPRSIPEHIKVENEILEALKGFTRPIHPADIKLWSTNSRAVKSKAISRLVRRGLIIEERVDPYTRFISLPQKEN